MSWFEDAGNGKAVDVAAMLDNDAPAILWDIVQAGAMVSCGTTSDGGALGVTVTLDGRWRREYFRDGDELVRWLADAVEAVRLEANDRLASSGRRKRSRRSE